MRSPAYLDLHRRGLLLDRVAEALACLKECTICPRVCGVNRLKGETKVCRTGRHAQVSGFGPHFGEEAPLVGQGGSGTIFFTHCNLGCIYCQNYDISHGGAGREAGPRDLADMMLDLQSRGCHNINLVTPTHVTPQILEALPLAIEGGLRLPLVYNCGGYETVETLSLLDGIVDIYMPDCKYGRTDPARRFSGARDYPGRAREALREMHRQVGDLVMDEGIAVRGLLVRHLVLPGGLSGTAEVTGFLAGEISPRTYVNVMDQYRPCYRADRHPPLDRRISAEEYRAAVECARAAGLFRLDGYRTDIEQETKGGEDHGNDNIEGLHWLRGV